MAASKGFNYSKWDAIELSDDESDLHPNIDKESWFRMKHRSRLEREEREDHEMLQWDRLNEDDQRRLKIVNARIAGIESGKVIGEDAELEDIEGLQAEARELSGRIGERKKRAKEFTEKRAWNIDNICKTKEERTIVSTSAVSSSLRADDFEPTGATELAMKKGDKAEAEKTGEAATARAAVAPPAAPQGSSSSGASSSGAGSSSSSSRTAAASKPPAPAPVPASKSKAVGPVDNNTSTHTAVISYNDYVLAHEDTLEAYSEIKGLEETKEFLFKNCDVLMHEHSQSYMLLSSLEDEMNGKKERMKLVCRQSQILSHIQELGASMKRDPRDVILPFFHRIAEPTYLGNFLGAVEDFAKRIRERAVVKRREMDIEAAREVAKQGGGVPAGPGGLDPYEVLASLPMAMQEAFESQDVQRLKDVLAAMDPVEASRTMKLCVDSGLWVANASGGEDDDEEGEEEDGGEGGQKQV